MPAARSSKSEAIITVFFWRATLPRASVDGPGIVSANLKSSIFSVWQKYCDRNSSCRQTICAPFLTASPMREIAFFRFASGFDSQAIWIRPTLTLLAAAFLTMRRSIAKRKRPRRPVVSEFRFVCSCGLYENEPRNHTKSHEQSRFVWLRGSLSHAYLARDSRARRPCHSFKHPHYLRKAWLAPAVALRIRWRVNFQIKPTTREFT